MLEAMSNPMEDNIADILKRFQERESNVEIRALAARVGDLATAVAVHNEREDAVNKRMVTLETTLGKVAEQVSNMDAMANKWRGAFLVLMGLGGSIGVFAAFWDRVVKWVHP